MSEAPRKPTVERTTLSVGLIGFYAGCAAVSLGAAIAASGWIVFSHQGMAALGLFMVVGGAIACFRCLRSARRE